MNKDEALRMAIEAMIYHIEQTRSIASTCIAIDACKEALQPDRAGLTYYRIDACKAQDANSPDCICWTPKRLESTTHEFKEPVTNLIKSKPMMLRFVERVVTTPVYGRDDVCLTQTVKVLQMGEVRANPTGFSTVWTDVPLEIEEERLCS